MCGIISCWGHVLVLIAFRETEVDISLIVFLFVPLLPQKDIRSTFTIYIVIVSASHF